MFIYISHRLHHKSESRTYCINNLLDVFKKTISYLFKLVDKVEFSVDILLSYTLYFVDYLFRDLGARTLPNTMISFKVQDIPNIASGTNLFAKLYFAYIAPIFFRTHRPLHETDISGLPEKRRVSQTGKEIERRWKNQLSSKRRSLARIFIYVFLKQIVLSTFLIVLEAVFLLAMIPIFGRILQYIQGEITDNRASVFLIADILLYHASSLANCWSQHESLCLGFEARAAFTRLVYDKCLKLTLNQCDRIESGYLSSLISTDSYSFDMFAEYGVRVLGSILRFIMVFTFCYLYIDTFAAIAICVYLTAYALIPVYLIGLRLIRKHINRKVDERLRNLAIYCRFAQTFKMCCLDTVIYKVMCRLNKKETLLCALKNIVEANSCTMPPLLHSFITLAYILISFKAHGNLPSGVKVYQLMAMSPILRFNFGSDVITFFTRFSEVKLAIERLQKLAEDVDLNCKHLVRQSENVNNDSHYAIELSSLSSSWDNEASFIILRNISLKIEKGTLTYIVGPSKSGKTSLLFSILNELHIGCIECMNEQTASNSDEDTDSSCTQQDYDFELITLDKVARRYSMCSQHENSEVGGFAPKSRTVDAVGWIKLLGKLMTPNKIGAAIVPFLILFWCGSHTFRILSEYWLSRWLSTEKENDTKQFSDNAYETFYLGYLFGFVICAGSVLLIITGMIGYDTFCAHSKSLAKVMGSYSFIFEKVLRGITFNQLSFDIGVMQNFVPISIYEMGQDSSQIFAFMIYTCCICPLSVAFVLPAIFAILVLIYHQINLTASGYQMESDTRTNMLTHLIATHQGLVSIRASKAKDKMISEFEYTIDTNNQLRYTLTLLDRIAQLTVDFVILLVMLVTTSVFLFFYNGTAEVGQLAVTYTLVVTEDARLFIKEIQLSINYVRKLLSVARVFDLYGTVQEPNAGSPDDIEESPYVDNSIKFVNVRFKYFKDLPIVLNGLDLTIKPKSKVAIVGPSGAGKSTIFGAIFRLGIVEGKIIVGGVDTESINLTQLRRSISLLPQEAVLMKTSIRLNLDPFQTKSDTEIWDVLQKVGLDNRIRQLRFPDSRNKLDYVCENESEFGISERQLLWLAKILLERKSIVLIDEASSKVDQQTQIKIKETINSELRESTIISIMHKLEDAINSDVVMLVKGGHLVESGKPSELLANENSIFYQMMKTGGKFVETTEMDRAEYIEF
ncbi:hypothetical protein ACOME3_008096 [Neoechinorhynchus agilis]